MARDPSSSHESRRHSHAHSHSTGPLLSPRTRSNRSTVRAVYPAAPGPQEVRRPSGRIPRDSYAERHRAAFGAPDPARKASRRQHERLPGEADEPHSRVSKRKRHQRRTTNDHNHYQQRTISEKYNRDVERTNPVDRNSGPSATGRDHGHRKARRRKCLSMR